MGLFKIISEDKQKLSEELQDHFKYMWDKYAGEVMDISGIDYRTTCKSMGEKICSKMLEKINSSINEQITRTKKRIENLKKGKAYVGKTSTPEQEIKKANNRLNSLKPLKCLGNTIKIEKATFDIGKNRFKSVKVKDNDTMEYIFNQLFGYEKDSKGNLIMSDERKNAMKSWFDVEVPTHLRLQFEINIQ